MTSRTDSAPATVSLRRILPPAVTGQEVVLVGVIAVLWVLLGIFTPSFLSPASVGPLLVNVAPVALIGIGMTFVIITGGIDVSVAGMAMVCAVVTARLLVSVEIPLIVALLVSVVIGGILGSVNGFLVAYARVHPIIITFGTWNLFLYIGYRTFNSSTVNGIPSTFDVFGKGAAGTTLGVPNAFAIVVALVAAAWWFLRYTRAGRNLFAIGGNAEAARLTGIAVRPRLVWVYVITGVMVGVAACVMLASGTSSLDQSVGNGKELEVIAAVVIGGTSIMGGRGSVVGTLLGALLVQTVSVGVIQLGWPSQLSRLFVGVFIIIAVGADILRERARRRSGRMS
ncbi:ABC transporter permease [Microbacterium sp. SYP-A9085]|jgi:ribose transport system permease protein|uniref:ABC transporter permease n=1 Tax=Microbacterium sp. SYP-A9085 TaxID=2664454 RepID=UPI00129B7ECC|nr:ABC transporter permease [Microbacterium sp. SYP-A9085]MRH28021.1 ABC transporter permease [Microbacterium sp. SYP-A9085]